jgi:hypothetical protein
MPTIHFIQSVITPAKMRKPKTPRMAPKTMLGSVVIVAGKPIPRRIKLIKPIPKRVKRT